MPIDMPRELDAGDGRAVRELVLRILNVEYAMALTLAELPDLVDVHATYCASGEGNFWTVSHAGAVCGCIGVIRLAGTDFELRRMYVAADYRGQGIAQRLLDVAMAWCRREGVGALYLETNAQWRAAQHIYAKHGFEPVPRACLPPTFPVVRVATGFYRLRLAA